MNIARLDTYAKARAEVISYTEQKAAKADADSGGAAPMELDAFKGQPKGGKAGGRKGKDSSKGNPDKDIVCHHCGKKGHRKSNCWQAAKGSSSKGGKGSGKDSKGQGKVGKGKGGKGKAHVLEGADVERQEWPAEEEPEEGTLGYLRALGGEPSVASAPAPNLGLKVVKRPRFCKQYSWFWSQPWKKVLAECSLAGEPRGDEFFQCPVPGCSGRRRTFQSGDSLSQHLWSKSDAPGHPQALQFRAWEAELKRGHFVRLDPRDELAYLRGSIEHCNAEEPQWVYLPSEPDYSLHEVLAEFDEESEEEEIFEEDEVVEEPPTRSARGRSPLPRRRAARSPLPRRRSLAVQSKVMPRRPSDPKQRRGDAPVYVPPHRRLPAKGVAESAEEVKSEIEKKDDVSNPPSSSKGEGAVSTSKRTPAPYRMTTASRAILLGELLSQNHERLEELRASLDTAESEESYQAISQQIEAASSAVDELKEEQKRYRARESHGRSSRQEADKASLGGRLAYLQEKSRKRAAKHRLKGQNERTLEKLDRERQWHARFDRPGSGRKVPVFPLAEGELRKEVAAAPLSRKARSALLEEEEKDFLALPPVSRRTRTLPPSERRSTAKKRKAKHLRERRREQRKKVKRDALQGRASGVGLLASLSGTLASAESPSWTGSESTSSSTPVPALRLSLRIWWMVRLLSTRRSTTTASSWPMGLWFPIAAR